jgi:hypothetical protein
LSVSDTLLSLSNIKGNLFLHHQLKNDKMKSLITTTIIFLTTVFSVHSQSSLLNSYYEIKNALVNSDAATASAKANEFIKASDSINIPTLKDKLISDAKLIAATKDIQAQRNYFANLSLNLYSLAKQTKLSDDAIYQAYCPMKKMYWLSSEKGIKNPYYGKMMLTCGNVTDTIKP